MVVAVAGETHRLILLSDGTVVDHRRAGPGLGLELRQGVRPGAPTGDSARLRWRGLGPRRRGAQVRIAYWTMKSRLVPMYGTTEFVTPFFQLPKTRIRYRPGAALAGTSQ